MTYPIRTDETWAAVLKRLDTYPDATLYRLQIPDDHPAATWEDAEVYGVPDELAILKTDAVPGGCIM